MTTAIVLSDLWSGSYNELDGSVKHKVMDFVVKLQRDPTTPGLDLKQPATAIDKRLRTARVNDFWRAVLIELPGSAGYVLVAVKPHDDAYVFARNLVMSVNEITGALEIVNTEALATAVTKAAASVAPDAKRVLPAAVRKRDLVNLGVGAEVAEQLLAITDEDVLLEVADALPRSQSNAVLDLCAGLSPEQVWAAQAGEESGTLEEPATVDPEDFSAALARPLSRLSFTDLARDGSSDELRAVMEGSMAAWRVWLHPLQRRLANHDGWKGPFRVTGGAGTGKTVTAIHRARHLARRLEQTLPSSDGKVLVTTYTKNLVQVVQSQLVQLAGPDVLKSVDVVNIDALARRIVVAGADHSVARAQPVSDTDSAVRALWAEAKRVASFVPGGGEAPALNAAALDTGFLEEEWMQVVLGGGISSEAEYLRASRSGRGRRLTRPQRAVVWKVIDEHTRLLRERGVVTFTQLAAQAATMLEADPSIREARGYLHAVVDEAQDLHPAHWRLLRRLVPEGPDDLFVVGDAHQRIYGRPVPLSRFGIETRGRSRRLTVNYRTSRQILRWCLGVVDPSADDLDTERDTMAGARSVFAGPTPLLREFDSLAKEAAGLIAQLQAWAEEGIAPGDTAVFARERNTIDRVRDELCQAGIGAVELGAQNDEAALGDRVRLLTMHRAKGLEFRAVALVGLGAADFPPKYLQDLSGEERAREERKERNLLYVAGSRARERLWVSWTGEPSGLLGSAEQGTTATP